MKWNKKWLWIPAILTVSLGLCSYQGVSDLATGLNRLGIQVDKKTQNVTFANSIKTTKDVTVGGKVAGQIVIALNFGDDNVSASQSAAEWGITPGLDVGGDQKRVVVPYGYVVTAITVNSNAATTADGLVVAPTMDGTASTTMTCGLNSHAGSTITSSTTNLTGFYIPAGHQVGVKATTLSGFLPTTADVNVTLYLKH